MARKRTSDDLGQDAVQAATDAAEEKGYIGRKSDPTPNENYTVEGVTAGLPTPETDPDAAAEAHRTVHVEKFGNAPKK